MKTILLQNQARQENTGLGLLAICIIIVAIVIYRNYRNSQNTKRLKITYEGTLRGNNKKAALDAGRLYYSSLRKGKRLTIYDEQALTNDISAMNV